VRRRKTFFRFVLLLLVHTEEASQAKSSLFSRYLMFLSYCRPRRKCTNWKKKNTTFSFLALVRLFYNSLSLCFKKKN
jgi:hypothetical protein